MAGKIETNAVKHGELEATLKKIATALTAVEKELANLKAVIQTEMEGNGAKAAQQAIQKKVEALKKSKKSWETTMKNTKELQAALLAADKETAKAVSK